MKTIWKKIPKYPDYSASSLGQIRNDRTMHILKHENKINGAGYYGVAIGRKRGDMVHRLVCMAFHGMPTEDRPTVNHKNCNKLDNRPENLEWMSQMENATHMRQMGRHDAHAKNMSKKCRGVGNPKAKLTEK